jgi:hypothetical protein
MRNFTEIKGEYKGFNYEVMLYETGHRCGYITVPEQYSNVVAGEYWNNNLDVHGGITYQAGNVIGFDCIHAGDDVDRAAAYETFGNPEIHADDRDSFRGHVWTKEEVEAECKSAIDQIIDRSSSKSTDSRLCVVHVSDSQLRMLRNLLLFSVSLEDEGADNVDIFGTHGICELLNCRNCECSDYKTECVITYKVARILVSLINLGKGLSYTYYRFCEDDGNVGEFDRFDKKINTVSVDDHLAMFLSLDRLQALFD